MGDVQNGDVQNGDVHDIAVGEAGIRLGQLLKLAGLACAIRRGSRWGASRPGEGQAPLVRQSAYIVARAHKPAALSRVLDIEAPAAALVFCRTRAEVDQLAESLNGRGYRAEAMHGGMDQAQRDRVMGRLRSGTADLIVATDVAARGLDIDQLTHVINYDVPADPESYIHRIGRVGRAGREGVAVTLAEPREHRMLKAIERMTKQPIVIEKVPTIADLRARQLEMTRSALHESILENDLEDHRQYGQHLLQRFLSDNEPDRRMSRDFSAEAMSSITVSGGDRRRLLRSCTGSARSISH